MSFTIVYDDNDQQVIVSGTLSPQSARELDDLRAVLARALKIARGTLQINVKRLRRLNNIAFREFLAFVNQARHDEPDLKISVVTSTMVGWSARKFQKLHRINPNVAVVLYDEKLYPGQEVIEDQDFVPVLRSQTRMTWRHEKHILPRHGLQPGMTVADICCGIGDFAVLLHKEFAPAHVVAVDLAKSSLDYARHVAAGFGIRGVDYVHGDASDLLLDSDQFDFVTCRHALQIFDAPQLILKELYRICKPGGRVYVTNEKFSHCLGEPRAASIRWTYQEAADLFAHFNMDLELGPKNRRYLLDAGFEDVRQETFMVASTDGDPREFAEMIEAWEAAIAGGMCARRGDTEEYVAQFRRGFQDHIAAALHPKGYAGWPIWVASGRKPQ